MYTSLFHVCTHYFRFGSDYELRGQLGKGGFGVVYHVKNRTDDGEYAVKRILLPRKWVIKTGEFHIYINVSVIWKHYYSLMLSIKTIQYAYLWHIQCLVITLNATKWCLLYTCYFCRKSAREKVMREVHALAQLDHANIVRYFHSWVEQAPEGWQHQEQWVPLSRTES